MDLHPPKTSPWRAAVAHDGPDKGPEEAPPIGWLPRGDAEGGLFDPFVSLALHRAAADLARTASGYDLRHDGFEVLDRLANLCIELDAVAVNVWRGALSPATNGEGNARCREDPLDAIREQLCVLLHAYARGLADESVVASADSSTDPDTTLQT